MGGNSVGIEPTYWTVKELILKKRLILSNAPLKLKGMLKLNVSTEVPEPSEEPFPGGDGVVCVCWGGLEELFILWITDVMFSKPHPNSSFSTESGAGAKTVPGTAACETKTEPGFCGGNAFKFLWWKSTYKDSIGSGERGLCVCFFFCTFLAWLQLPDQDQRTWRTGCPRWLRRFRHSSWQSHPDWLTRYCSLLPCSQKNTLSVNSTFQSIKTHSFKKNQSYTSLCLITRIQVLAFC